MCSHVSNDIKKNTRITSRQEKKYKFTSTYLSLYHDCFLHKRGVVQTRRILELLRHHQKYSQVRWKTAGYSLIMYYIVRHIHSPAVSYRADRGYIFLFFLSPASQQMLPQHTEIRYKPHIRSNRHHNLNLYWSSFVWILLLMLLMMSVFVTAAPFPSTVLFSIFSCFVFFCLLLDFLSI